jgi:hypothetical protein
MEEDHVPLASLNPSIPISSPGRVQRTRVGPLASGLPPDTSGVRRTCQLILRLTSLSFQTSRLCLHLPTPLVLAALLVAVVGSRGAMLPSARITWRVNMRISCRREALERASDIEGRRRRPGLRLLCVFGSLATPSLDELG